MWGSTNYSVARGACLVGSSSPCCLCHSCRACLVPNPMLTFAIAAGVRPVVVGGWAAARVMLFCAVSACLWLSARHCNMAIGPALVAMGHIALIVKEFDIFWLMVVKKPMRDQSVSFFWCSHVN